MKKLLSNRILQLGLVLIIGLFLGWLIFRTDHSTTSEHKQEQGKETTYTCSMHPQIRQNEPGKCPICGMDLIPLTSKSDKGDSSPFVHTMSPEAIALANVQTQKVKSTSPEYEIYLSGKVAINEQKLAVITANYSGRVENLYIDFTGQTISKGQRLASIYSPELVTAQMELIEASKHKEINPALYNASSEKLRLWKIAESQVNEIERRGVVLTEFDVYADRSGIVTRRDISKGDFVSKGTVLFEIVDLSNVWILFDAYESDLPLLRVGQKVSFAVTSIPRREFTSNITFIDPFVNPQTRTAAVRAEISNPQQILKPEMFVKGKVNARLATSDKSLVIPNTSLLWTGKRSIVYVKVPNAEFPSFEMREITLGASLGEFYVVESGLTEGDEIVTNGVFAIDGAAQLSGNYSMMNRPIDDRIAVPEKFTNQLSDFVNQYFELKNGLVKSDFQLSQTNSKKLESALVKIDMNHLSEEAHSVWMEHLDKLKKSIGQLQRSKDIEKQREIFSPLSNQIVESTETFGLSIETVYVAFCPMALNNEGAYWLSEFEEIKNPYYGDAMLRCGEVKKKISRKSEVESKPKQSQVHQH